MAALCSALCCGALRICLESFPLKFFEVFGGASKTLNFIREKMENDIIFSVNNGNTLNCVQSLTCEEQGVVVEVTGKVMGKMTGCSGCSVRGDRNSCACSV